MKPDSKKIKKIVKRVAKVVRDQQVEGEIEITPGNIHISIRPLEPFEMKYPYGKGEQI